MVLNGNFEIYQENKNIYISTIIKNRFTKIILILFY